MKVTPFFGKALKAIFAAASTLLGGLGTALVGAQTFSAISDAQWITIASLTVAAFGAVYGVTNATSSTASAKSSS